MHPKQSAHGSWLSFGLHHSDLVKALFWGKVNKKEVVHGSNSQFPIYIGKRNSTDSTESFLVQFIQPIHQNTLTDGSVLLYHAAQMKAPPRVCRPSSQELTRLEYAIWHRHGQERINKNKRTFCFSLGHGSNTNVKMMELAVGAIPQHRPVLPQSCECT